MKKKKRKKHTRAGVKEAVSTAVMKLTENCSDSKEVNTTMMA